MRMLANLFVGERTSCTASSSSTSSSSSSTSTFKMQTGVSVLFLLALLVTLAACEKHHHQDVSNRSNSINKRTFGGGGGGGGGAGGGNNSEEDDGVDGGMHAALAGCGSCKMREEIKNRNLDLIKGEVLRRMGFQQAPNVTGRVLPQVPPQYLAMFDDGYGGMQSDQPHQHHQQFKTGYSISEEIDEFHVKTEKVLTFAQPYPRLRHAGKEHQILYFGFSDRITKYHVSNASLFVFVRGAASDRRPTPDVLIEVFKVFDRDGPSMRRVAAKKVAQPSGKGDWVRVDLTVTVSEWFKNPKENYGFVINGTVEGGKRVAVTEATADGGTKEPFVEIVTSESKRRIRRSGSLNCDDKMNEPLCCRYPLTVDFEDFGWDFIIAPKRYDAYYCSGDCPYITFQKHAHTHLLHLASPNIAPPCCAPRKLSSIKMIYFDQDLNIVFGNLPGMVVDRCGCS